MNVWLAVAVGGALGSVLRFGASRLIESGGGVVWATFAVNAVGSLAAGVLFVVLGERLAADGPIRGFLMVGLLGALTTFSTFSLDTVRLLLDQAYLPAAANVLLNVIVCIAGCWAGVLLSRELLS